jgi:hypothetical protein
MKKYTDEIVRLTSIVKMEEQREKQQAKTDAPQTDITTKKKAGRATDTGTGTDPLGTEPVAGGLVGTQE